MGWMDLGLAWVGMKMKWKWADGGGDDGIHWVTMSCWKKKKKKKKKKR